MQPADNQKYSERRIIRILRWPVKHWKLSIAFILGVTATVFFIGFTHLSFSFTGTKCRRARMGTAMMGQDYAHWHGFFELAQDLDKMKKIYNELMEK